MRPFHDEVYNWIETTTDSGIQVLHSSRAIVRSLPTLECNEIDELSIQVMTAWTIQVSVLSY